MIHWLIDRSIHHRGLVLVAATFCALAGLVCAFRTPMDAVPDLSENQVIVFAHWPGHGPQEVDESLTRPLSLQLQGLPGVRSVRGSSDVGYSTIYLIFEDRVSLATARQRTRERLLSLETTLPTGVVPQLAADGIPTGQIFWYTVEGQGFDLAQLRSLQDWTIAPQLRSVDGVAEVASVGGFVSELQIEVDPNRLAGFGLTIRELGDELTRSTTNVTTHVLQKATAEFVVQLGSESANGADATRGLLGEWEQRLISLPNGTSIRLGDVARITWGPAPRRGLFEKDGNEAVAGIVHLRQGHNPLTVTRDVRTRICDLLPSLPAGVRIVPCYDRTPLIVGAVSTVTGALLEALFVAAFCVLLVLRHVRAWLVIALALPLAVLSTFLAMSLLRWLGWIDIQSNIMSLAGIAISIGVLVDSSIVLTENVMYRLRQRFGDRPVVGDVRELVAEACKTVGAPVFGSSLVMLVSFAPVFALSGIDGRMYQPLAWTKSLVLLAAALIAVTVVPALCSVLVRGRMHDETESAIVRGVIGVYRPILSSLLENPTPLLVILSITFVIASAPLGNDLFTRLVLFGSLLLMGFVGKTVFRRLVAMVTIALVALFAGQTMRPIGVEMRLPLDEGTVMDMPITIPRASITQSGDDLKARNMMLCRFPEVAMVTGKAGRAETPFDPAPLDMIETMIDFRPRQHWPKRRLHPKDAQRMASAFLQELNQARLVDSISHAEQHELVESAVFRFDAIQRETIWRQTQVFQNELRRDLGHFIVETAGRSLQSTGHFRRAFSTPEAIATALELPAGPMGDFALAPSEESLALLWPKILASAERLGIQQISSTSQREPTSDATFLGGLRGAFGLTPITAQTRALAATRKEFSRRWDAHVAEQNGEIRRRFPILWLRLIAEESFSRGKITDPELAKVWEQILRVRSTPPKPHKADKEHHGLTPMGELPLIDPHARFDGLVRDFAKQFENSVTLLPHDAESIAGFGGEMDRVLQMPGWTNVWTRPIQNRVDMLTTGVNSDVGVRVLGRRLNDVVFASQQIAEVLKEVPGAVDVVADPIRGKGVIEITPLPAKAAEAGVLLTDLHATLEAALGGRIVGQLQHGPEPKVIRFRSKAEAVETDDESLRRLPIPVRRSIERDRNSNPSLVANAAPATVPLETVATVQVADGPATIKSENGWLRNYVRLNVRDRSAVAVVADARRAVASRVTLPQGVFVEWTGQYEHANQTRQMLFWLTPCLFLVVFAILFHTYRDWADASLMLLSAPGALAGGVLCQWLLGYKFSIAVGVGYIACFGMAAATSIVMLVYLREAIDKAGGLAALTLPELKQTVLLGAVHRLRPKLLTEATTLLGLAPMLWSTGVGAEVIRPMAAPVLGGILVADEVVDLLIPVLFYHIRRRRWEQMRRKTEPATTADVESSAPTSLEKELPIHGESEPTSA